MKNSVASMCLLLFSIARRRNRAHESIAINAEVSNIANNQPMGRGHTLRIAFGITVIALLLLAGSALAQQPLIPAGYYGSITVNGQPVPSGTVIVAMLKGERRGELTTTVSGAYGGPEGQEPKLWVKRL